METPKSPTSIDHRIREALERLATVLRIDDWNRAKAAGLNPTQLAILELLEGRPTGSGVKEIAFHLGVSQPTATDSITALERKGLVEKRAAPGDRRAVTVVASSEGLTALAAATASDDLAGRAVGALASTQQEHLLLVLVTMIRQLQEVGAIPVQRMCVTCRHFRPFAHSDAARPHHCHLVNAAFGQRDLRVDCREHETADPASRAATWDAFSAGSAPTLQAPQG